MQGPGLCAFETAGEGARYVPGRASGLGFRVLGLGFRV